jgi:hypothetical protein
MVFRAKRDCEAKGRFQIWFHSTGTLWVDDVELRQSDVDLYRPGRVIAGRPTGNLIPNASFECGGQGWGSAQWEGNADWGGGMNSLFGQLDYEKFFDGKASLRIDVVQGKEPVRYFAYYELTRQPVRAPLAGNEGFIEVEPGKSYCLSAYLKGDRNGVPIRLAVRQFQARGFEKAGVTTTNWQRFTLTFKPTARWCYVLAGPDLRVTRENPKPPASATV